jgi:hypothetical protein
MPAALDMYANPCRYAVATAPARAKGGPWLLVGLGGCSAALQLHNHFVVQGGQHGQQLFNADRSRIEFQRRDGALAVVRFWHNPAGLHSIASDQV